MLKIYRVGFYTELFLAIIPTLFPYSLLICYPYILLHIHSNVFILILFMSLFVEADACLS